MTVPPEARTHGRARRARAARTAARSRSRAGSCRRPTPPSSATVDARRRRASSCVYKPVAGERPLWDFPDGTLAGREVAAYVVSEALGWDVVPPTVLRGDAPAGIGMVQAWREPDAGAGPGRPGARPARCPEGYLHVLDAYDGDDRPVSLVHEDTDALRRMAVFDVVVNNADRKGGHVLAMTDGHRFGVDHGLCFHVDDKLRTVLWGWARRAARRRRRRTACAALVDQLRSPAQRRCAARCRELLAGDEVAATLSRAASGCCAAT